MISKVRNFQRLSTKRLKRARRLYLYLAFESVLEADDPNTMIAWCAHRMISSGLYHRTLGLRQATHGVLCTLYRMDKQANPYHPLFQEWHWSDSARSRWMKLNGIKWLTNLQAKAEVGKYINQQQGRIAA